MTRSVRDRLDRLLEAYGTTYAEAAGITLRDTPSALYQLLVLTTTSSARIDADVAAAAARELFAAGWRTPEAMRGASWQQRVDALGRGGYRRYDESTATKLEEQAAWLLETYDGDLRRLHPSDHAGVRGLERAIAEAPRIGPMGARIFCREVQDVWPEVSPYFDRRALDQARRLGLPDDPHELTGHAPRGEVARLATALVRAALDDGDALEGGDAEGTGPYADRTKAQLLATARATGLRGRSRMTKAELVDALRHR